MLSEKFFTQADLEEFQAAAGKFRKIMAIAMAVISVIIIAIWSLVIWSRGSDMLPFMIGGFVLFAAFETWIYLKMVGSIKKDMNEQIKLSGEVTVLSRQSVKNNFIIKFDDEELKEIGVTKKLYDKINTGDRLYLEISRHHRHIFKINRGGEELK